MINTFLCQKNTPVRRLRLEYRRQRGSHDHSVMNIFNVLDLLCLASVKFKPASETMTSLTLKAANVIYLWIEEDLIYTDVCQAVCNPQL